METDEIKELKEKLIENGANEEAIEAYCSIVGEEYLDSFEEAYQGQWDNDEEFAQQLAEDLGTIDKDHQWPTYCIDWEWAAKEIMMDYSEDNGYYFLNL